VNKHEMVDSPKIGVLLTNLGTPDKPTKAAVRPFLKAYCQTQELLEHLHRDGFGC